MKILKQLIFIFSAVIVGMIFAFLTKESVSIAKSLLPENIGKIVYIEEAPPGILDDDKPEFEYDEKDNYQDVPKISPKYKKINNNLKFPEVTSKSYIVADLDTGDIIAYKYPDKVYPIASISKLMTALVSVETLEQENQISISRRAVATYGAAGNLSSGDVLTFKELLYPLLLSSSNDAAEAIAEGGKRARFIGNMNGKAKSIGLLNTEFDDPSGLSARNVSTSRDLFNLVKYIYEEEPEILDITRIKQYDLNDWTWFNNNKFRNDDNYLGGKNGFTDYAQHTLLSTFKLPLGSNGENRNIGIVLLNGQSTEKDMRKITAYLNKNIEYRE